MNKSIPFYQTAIAVSTLICMSTSFVETSKDSDHKHSEKELPTIEQHPPHEHGAATLTIAIDKNKLEIDLESPADNIFGFEYAPSSDADKKKVKYAVKQLKAAKTLFTMPESAQCQLDQVEVLSPMLEPDGDKKDSMKHHDDHDKKDAKEHHEKHSKKESKEHHHDDHHHDKEGSKEHQHVHNDVDASWHYSCESTEQLKSITPHFFSVFSSGFKQLKVEWLTPSGVSSRMITEDKRIEFKGTSE